MAMNEAQKEYVKAVIDYMLAFSSETETLKEQICFIEEALTQTVHSEHEFYHLARYFLLTTETLAGVERYSTVEDESSALKVGEIQAYILEEIIKAIKEAATEQDEELTSLIAHLETVFNRLVPEENLHTVFKPIQTRVDTPPPPWEKLHTDNQIFTAKLIASNDNQIFIEFTIPGIIDRPHFIKLTQIPFDDPDPYKFLLQCIIPAQFAIIKWVSNYVLESFFKWDIISSVELKKGQANPHFSHVIVNEYYFNLFQNKGFSTDYFESITAIQAEKLINKSVIALQKNNLCTFENAIELTQQQIDLLPHYNNMLSKNELMIDDLKVRPEQTNILFVPLIMNLIKEGKLKFEDAKNIPSYFKDIFLSSLYLDFFSTREINWKKLYLLFQSDCKFLLQPRIAELLKNNVFDLLQIPQFMLGMREILSKSEAIRFLLINNLCTIEDLDALNLKTIELLHSHPGLFQWISAGIMSVKDIATLPKEDDILINAYVIRLIALLNKQPYILNNEDDSIDNILKELATSEFHPRVPLTDFRESVISKFLTIVTEELITMVPFLDSHDRKLLNKLNDLHKKIKRHQLNCTEAFAELIEYLDKDKASAQNDHPFSQLFSFFAPEKPKEGDNFCKNLISLRNLVPESREQVFSIHFRR